MATPHINAEMGDFAKTVLLAGDPLRAKFIAETFLEDVKQVNHVRGMLGYTGTYQGKKISVMGSGMGMPSIGIYSYELYSFYGVENIVRIGSAGAYCPEMKLFDVVLGDSAYSESSYAKMFCESDESVFYPSAELNQRLKESAERQGISLIEGRIHSSDNFYYHRKKDLRPHWQTVRDEQGCVCAEMESFALFANAMALGKKAACLVTISDSLVSSEETTSEQRQTGLTNMMKVALGADYE